jgi:hypothetical protein
MIPERDPTKPVNRGCRFGLHFYDTVMFFCWAMSTHPIDTAQR